MTDNDTKEASVKVRDTIRYTMILTIPCAVGFLALSSPIMQLIFNDSTKLASGIMQTGSLLIVLLGLSTLTTGILQGLGRMKEPLIHSAIALVLHLIVLAVLMTVFKLNIYGVLYSNIFFGLIMCILNAISIKKYLRYRQELVRTFIIPLVFFRYLWDWPLMVFTPCSIWLREMLFPAWQPFWQQSLYTEWY